MANREVQIGTLTFRVYNESRDKQHVNIEVIAGDGSTGNIDCSLREWHALQDAAFAAKATTRIVELTPENCRHNRAIEPDTGECLDCGTFLP